MTKQPFETATLHFNLNYASEFGGFTLHTGDRSYSLTPHTAETRARFRAENAAMSRLPEARLDELSHFAEDVELPSDVVRLLRVTADPPSDQAPLPPLAAVKIHIPAQARRRCRRRRLRRTGQLTHSTLKHFGLSAQLGGHDEEAVLDLHADADLLCESPLETAKCLAFHHPQLASRDEDTGAEVMDNHIDEATDLLAFATLISKLGPATEHGGWATITPSVDKDGNVMTWGPGWEKEGHEEGTPVYHYRLNDEIAGGKDTSPGDPSGLSVVNEALRTSQNDEELKDKKWSVELGAPDLRKDVKETSKTMAELLEQGTEDGYKFTLNNRTPGYGLDVPKDSMSFESEAGFGIDAHNVFLRTLVAYVQFRDIDGKAIPNPPGWEDRMPEFLRNVFESDTKKYVTNVSPVNVILGIPMPTDPTQVDFQWPEGAASCDLLFGGLGTRNWDGVVDPPGIILTGVFQYGVPLLFLAGGAAITSSAWYKAFIANRDLFWAVVGVGFGAVGGGVSTAAALLNTKQVLFAFGDAIAGILVKKGLEKLATYILARLTAAQMASAVPVVGWGFRIANMAITAINLAETTVEVLISPCTYSLEVKRELPLEVTVEPDPLHGDPPIWPEVATHYVVTVQYKNGTNYTVTGRLPGATGERDKPIVAHFPELPTGGEFQVVCGVYSDTDWLAGNWTSTWTRAVLPHGKPVLKLEGAIRENLVPLTTQTQYLYKAKLVYEDQVHKWHEGDQPTAVVTDLDGGATGHNLSHLVNLTINNKAYMLGYCWQASGQNLPLCGSDEPTTGQIFAFQNISTLADPEAALKFPSCGFSAQPYLIYDQFGPAPLFSLDKKFTGVLDLGDVDKALRQAFKENIHELPPKVKVNVVLKETQWHLFAESETPTYDLRRAPDASISVFDYPTPLFSPNNFYVDTRGERYHLRRVTLDDHTPFDMSPTESFGYFTQPHLDSVVIHPAGYAIGVNWKNSKMEMIHIPEEGTTDQEAQPASMLSGQGQRLGLMNGPKALTVTADGRILVLETVNHRIQSFDIHGNPVASFVGDDVCTVDKETYARDLDAGRVTVALRDAFQQGGVTLSPHWRVVDGNDQFDVRQRDDEWLDVQMNGAELSSEWWISEHKKADWAPAGYEVKAEHGKLEVYADGTRRFTLPLECRVALDRGVVDDTILAAFKEHGLELSQQAAVTGNGLQVSSNEMTDLARGVVPAGLRQALATRDVTLSEAAEVQSLVVVKVESPGSLWILQDNDTTRSYRITVDPDDEKRLKATHYSPFMPLYRADPDEKFTYLDMGTEMKGYIFVLGYTGNGKKENDYKLDIYDPQGHWLSRTPDTSIEPRATGVNAAKLVVDMWRTMFTLNFEHFQGPGGRTEPSVSRWLPTTPKNG